MISRFRCRTLTAPFFFFNDTATTEIYTLSLHDALPILICARWLTLIVLIRAASVVLLPEPVGPVTRIRDRKSTRLNSSHGYISYAVFCLKKKKQLGSPAREKGGARDAPTIIGNTLWLGN